MPRPARVTEIDLYRGGSALTVTVVPRSRESGVDLLPDGSLRVRVTARPADGAANLAVLRVLADALELPRSALAIASGHRARRKRIAVSGIGPDDLATRLQRVSAKNR
jgi:uncharacterized protein YggU (UPF0235/DUF167 family)